MAYFNFNDFFNLLKKYFTVIFFFLSILLSIFLIFMNSNSVSAEVISYQGVNGSAFSQADFNDIETSFNNVKNGATSYVCTLRLGQNALLAVIDSSNPIVFANLTGNSYIYSSNSYSYRLYWLLGGGRTTYIGTYNNVMDLSTNLRFDYSNSLPYICANIPVYNSNGVDVFWAPDNYNPFVAPALYPPADSQQNSNLVSGQFTFFIVTPGSLTASQEILMDVYNTTYTDSADKIIQTYHLNSSSPFYEEGLNDFEYVLTARFLDWFQVVNGNSYKIRLSWVNPNNPLAVDSVSYSWTMNLTATEQENESLKVQQEMNSTMQNINNSINETNSFLTSDYFDENTVIDGMGDIYVNELDNVPYNNMLGGLFDSLKNAFVNDTPIDFEFIIPFSNGQKITIPSDYISSHIPPIILGIIRVFYWYLISRYIFKDAWRTIDKIRQGSYFYSAEEDIKTEVL